MHQKHKNTTTQNKYTKD